jgi:hypothetical protein
LEEAADADYGRVENRAGVARDSQRGAGVDGGQAILEPGLAGAVEGLERGVAAAEDYRGPVELGDELVSCQLEDRAGADIVAAAG